VIHCKEDQFGNLLLSRTARLPKRPVIFVAHCDHPGFVARKRVNAQTLLADWHGFVEPEYFVGSPVRFSTSPNASRLGTVRRIAEIGRQAGGKRVRRVAVEIAGEIPPGTPGTWDVPAYRLQGRTIHAARIDDIAGLAAALAAIDLLTQHEVPHRAAILVTRAEEAGLIGASAAAFGHLLPKDAAIVSIECSLSQVDSPQGAGPIVRVGDRTSLFDPDLGDWLSGTAKEIALDDKTFAWQRKLMPGGTCEASVFRAAGYRTTGLCVPLRNYHNRNTERRRIEAETIDREDWLGLVRLIAGAACTWPARASAQLLARQFKGLLARHRRRLKHPLAED
jgi:endoglucanase